MNCAVIGPICANHGTAKAKHGLIRHPRRIYPIMSAMHGLIWAIFGTNGRAVQRRDTDPDTGTNREFPLADDDRRWIPYEPQEAIYRDNVYP